MGFDEDVKSKSKWNRGLIETIARWIPGYHGYREKNQRREMDKYVRDEIVRSLVSVKSDLSEIQRIVLDAGEVQVMKSVERIRTKLDTYSKTVESAQSGYSGIWETLKTLEGELDAVMEWDAKLLETTDSLKKLTKGLISTLDMGQKINSEIRDVERYIDELIVHFEEREKVLKGLTANKTEKEEKINKLTNKLR